MQEALPTFVHLYKLNVMNLTNNVTGPKGVVDVTHFTRLFDQLSEIFNIALTAGDKNYVPAVSTKLKKALESTIGESEHKVIDLMLNKDLFGEAGLQTQLKKRFHDALSPDLIEMRKKIGSSPRPDHIIHAPTHGKHDNHDMVMETARHFDLKEIFLGQDRFKDFKDVMKYGKRITQIFEEAFQPNFKQLKAISHAGAAKISVVAGSLHIPHKTTAVSWTGTAQGDGRAYPTDVETQRTYLQACKDLMRLPTGLKDADAHNSYTHLKTFKETWEKENFKALAAAHALHDADSYGSARSKIMNYVYDNAWLKAHDRADWGEVAMVTDDAGAAAPAARQAAAHKYDWKWYPEGFSREFHTLFYC